MFEELRYFAEARLPRRLKVGSPELEMWRRFHLFGSPDFLHPPKRESEPLCSDIQRVGVLA